jgi:SulP family sulfate permease
VPAPALKLLPFLRWRHRVTRTSLRADLLAGLVGALVVLPQAVAFATLAGMPPEYGLYCAMLPVAVAALWGSSWHQMSGPTNTLSLAVFATMVPLATPGSPDYVKLVLTLALLIGLMQLAMGLARLGTLVNFISHTVIVGFTAGAGLLIIAAQIPNFFGIPIPAARASWRACAKRSPHGGGVDPEIVATGLVTLVTAIAARRFIPRIQYMIVAMIVGSVFAYGLAVTGKATVPTVGTLPRSLPPLSFPSFDPRCGARARARRLGADSSRARCRRCRSRAPVGVRAGQRIDGNQEFIGRGLSNIAAAFASGYPSSGSFNRIALNFEAGARTPLAAVFSAVFLLAVVLAIAPLGAHLPLAVMAALLFASHGD